MTREELRRRVVSFDWAKWTDEWREQYAPLYRELLAAGGEAGATETGGAFDPKDPFVTALAERYIGERIVSLNETTKGEVQALVERAITEAQVAQVGDTPFELGTRIRDLLTERFGGYERWRADRIARTETALVYNHGALLSYRQNDVTHVVLSDGGPGGCDTCLALDGVQWTLERALEEPIGHPHCRRSFSPLLADEVAVADAA